MEAATLIVLVIFLLIVANGAFSMSEIAVVSSRRSQLQRRAEAGESGARSALALLDAPSHFFSTVQLWITLIGVLAGAIGGVHLANRISAVLATLGIPTRVGQPLSLSLVVVTISYASLVLGELLPKRVALSHAETVASWVAPVMQRLARLTRPLVWVLTVSTEGLARVLRVGPPGAPPITEDEIHHIIERGTREGVFEDTERDMVKRVLQLADRSVVAIMTPHPDLVYVDLDEPFGTAIDKLSGSGHSQFPVIQTDRDNVLGMLYAKDVLAASLAGKPVDLRAAVRAALFVPEGMTAVGLLDRFREEQCTVALVIDEYGSLLGIATLTDILEAIVGEMSETEDVVELGIVRRGDGSYLVDGAVSIDELAVVIGSAFYPDPAVRVYETVGGLVMTELGRVPKTGDVFQLAGVTYEVLDMDRRRVDKVLVSPPNPQSIAEPAESQPDSDHD